VLVFLQKMSGTQLLTQFKDQMTQFFDELIEQLPNEGDLIMARLVISSNPIPTELIINTFVVQLNANDNELREMVKCRDDTFFLEHDILSNYDFENKKEVNTKATHFKNIWLSDKVDDTMKDTIWAWFDAFIFLADKYTKKNK
jgi:hypothetical protein